ncbi:MAG: 4Fe-4S binding protein [Candidatus Bathyarchaeia archaeon]
MTIRTIMAEDAEEARIGIFLCECGGNIGDVVDVEAVRNSVREWDNVVVSRKDSYLCSKPAQDTIYEDIRGHKLNRVIVAACTPRMHLLTFQEVLKRAGLNPFLLEFVNIREHCSWVHGPQRSEDATRKALSLTLGGYERSFELEPLEAIREECSVEVLVIGGGIAGIMASLELEEQGFKVHLVERLPSVGGQMAKLTKVFPTLDCAQCILTPRIADVGRRPNISLLTYSEVRRVEGRPGNYSVEVFKKPRYVVEEECNGCGECAKVCPVEVPNEFDENLGFRKAIYIPFPQTIPMIYTIDMDACIECYKCFEACEEQGRKAIDFGMEGETVILNVGSIILATGYEQYKAEDLDEYGYGIYPDVMTMMELERLVSILGPTGGRIIKFSDRGDVKRVAIVLCAGSRDKNRYIPYCSRICCMYSLKQAIVLREMLDIDVWVFYTDIRATGRGYEELYWRAQEEGVIFVRGKVAEIWANRGSNRLVVRAEDTLTGNLMEEEFDLVCLALAMVPSPGLGALARELSLPTGEDGFILEKHPKLDPVDTLKTGVFACGCALGPKDVRDTVSDALAAATKTSSFIKEGWVTTSPEKAFVDIEACDGCGHCLNVCPSNAITLLEGKADIDPFLCTGCGGCIPECPSEAIDFKNSTERQMIAALRGLLHDKEEDEIRLIAFVEKTIGYTGVDFLGLDRTKYPPNIRVVQVPSTAIISLKHLLHAYSLGADGVLMIEGEHYKDERFTKDRIPSFKEELDEIGIDSMRFWYGLVELPAYRNIARIFELYTSTVEDLGALEPEVIEAINHRLGI